MGFDQAFSIFVSWQTAILCLGIYVITYTIRTIVEASWPGSKKNRWWTEVLLPLGPIGTGLLIASFAGSFPWPFVPAPWMARAMYSAICGLASGWAYSRLRSFMRAGQGTDELPPS